MTDLLRRVPWTQGPKQREALITREWLVTNGLGGYASGTVAGMITRRYHGLLIAALPSPFGRTVLLNHIWEQVRLADGRTVQLFERRETPEGLEFDTSRYLVEFRLEQGLPVWRFDVAGTIVERRVLMPHMQNTVHVNYRVLGGPPVRMKVRALLAFRGHEAPVSEGVEAPYTVHARGDRFEVETGHGRPPLRLFLIGQKTAMTVEPDRLDHVLYLLEQHRGYESRGALWSPGYFRFTLDPDHEGTLIGSTETWETIDALSPAAARGAEADRRNGLLAMASAAAGDPIAMELVLAADQFIISPAGRAEEEARARAAGDEVRTVIAGYHWFTDWGRDTMISLEGLTLVTGRQREAGYILRTFAHYVRDGLIPNMFPEGTKEGLYHTADATLWFFHALQRYLTLSTDRGTLRRILPTMLDIVRHHLEGTRFGIHVDPLDGLLHQGAEGFQLTWMDAKVDDWVVTPRRGKAVEINALWYNALCLLDTWLRGEGRDAEADEIAAHARRARTSFNERFWYADGGYLYDVVDGEQGDDTCCRPNQLFAIALDHPVLERDRWRPVLDVVRERLLTPVGLRSLAPGNREYKAQYYGDLRARDAAYHQGTVWGWLAGPFIDAWLKVHPDDTAGAREALSGFVKELGDAGLGTISEIFDAEPPYTPRGCIAQAWSVAEVLRAWVKTRS